MTSKGIPKLASDCYFFKERDNRLSRDHGKKKSDTIILFFFPLGQRIP